MIKLTLFNHKGGVGKTTLTVNIANALVKEGKKVLLVDADPQCNLTSFYLEESDLEKMLGESSDSESRDTIWSALRPIVELTGDIKEVETWEIEKNLDLIPGDVLLSDYEEALPTAWINSFARQTQGYVLMSALSSAVNKVCESAEYDVVIYDVGPNVGALNRSVILDVDYFITPVAADLFSLRALSTVGRSIARWVKDWETVNQLAESKNKHLLLQGHPKYLGYITSAFKVHVGRNPAQGNLLWENKIAPRVKNRVVDVLGSVDKNLILPYGNKIGDVKHYQSLAPQAQELGLPLGELRGYVNPGNYEKVDDAQAEFRSLAKEIIKRTGI